MTGKHQISVKMLIGLSGEDSERMCSENFEASGHVFYPADDPYWDAADP